MPVFICSTCGFKKPVPQKAVGKKAKCPKCQTMNIIVEQESAERPPVENEPDDSPVESSSKADFEPKEKDGETGTKILEPDTPIDRISNEVGAAPTGDEISNDEPLTPVEETAVEEAHSLIEGQPVSTDPIDEPSEKTSQTPPASESNLIADFSTRKNKLTLTWIVAFAMCGILIAIAATLLIYQMITFGVVCFALGILGFIASAVVYTFFSK